MNNQLIIDLMVIFQAINSWMFFRERHNIRSVWKENKIKKKLSLIVMFFLPVFVILSLINNPI